MDHFERSGSVRGPGAAALAGRTVAVAVVALLAVTAAVGLGVVALGGGPGPAVDAQNATASPADGTGPSPGDSAETVVGGADPVALTDDRESAATAGSAGTAAGASAEIDTTLIERAIHERVNEIRRDRDLPTLASDEDLAEIATYYSRRMADEEFFSHTGPDGQTLLDRYDRFGYDCRVDTGGQRYVTGGENLAYTYAYTPVQTEGGVVSYDGNETEIARGIVEGWMNSPGHRENLLRPYWNREGIGVVLDPENGQTQVIATQNFC
ncbi:CAP domain-containing protein [Halosimplex pelagicum]|uniref:CAP domain-containing protein n=1 Tax=Halosimplex pelagicum TaxID=869886 RepID=A0A7D5PG53_9EURY|nr:CAP domain-containing protein [Halosimplex pelagicum]QLH83459.1 CAP domain-containing protein [Halosimplex pelagicum]